MFKQHAFVWGTQQATGDITEADVRNWMHMFCERYSQTRLIDVVNEPPPHTTPSYADAIGGGTNGDWQWITNAFLWAREACPNAVLILNDYKQHRVGQRQSALHRYRQHGSRKRGPHRPRWRVAAGHDVVDGTTRTSRAVGEPPGRGICFVGSSRCSGRPARGPLYRLRVAFAGMRPLTGWRTRQP